MNLENLYVYIISVEYENKENVECTNTHTVIAESEDMAKAWLKLHYVSEKLIYRLSFVKTNCLKVEAIIQTQSLVKSLL